MTATALREILPLGLGLGTCCQLAPFQCRISALPESEPTAHALEAEEMPIPARLPVAPPLGTRFQLVPFQCRIRLWPLVVLPTAHASVAEVAATALSSPLGRPELRVCFQLVPFQCAISGLGLRSLPVEPTAQALSAEVAATAVRLPATLNDLLRGPLDRCEWPAARAVPAATTAITTPAAMAALAGLMCRGLMRGRKEIRSTALPCTACCGSTMTRCDLTGRCQMKLCSSNSTKTCPKRVSAIPTSTISISRKEPGN